MSAKIKFNQEYAPLRRKTNVSKEYDVRYAIGFMIPGEMGAWDRMVKRKNDKFES